MRDSITVLTGITIRLEGAVHGLTLEIAGFAQHGARPRSQTAGRGVMGYALNVMKLAVSVALMVPLAIEVTVWLQQPPPPEPWQRFEQAGGPSRECRGEAAEGMACCRLGDLCLAGTSRTLRG